jgi:DNA-directed RNA polymerase specialized sigma24 family protein
MFEGQRVVNGQVLVDQAMARTRSDEDDLELAVREHARPVYRIAYSAPCNHHDAEDATQEAFVWVVRYRRKLAGVRDPRTRLARIAWRVAIERRRRVAEVSLDDPDQVVRQMRSLAAGAEEIVLGEVCPAQQSRTICSNHGGGPLHSSADARTRRDLKP